ncbi:MAG TPA: RNase adapter RapZ, partial [Syntrophomonadaceae bacterium]|nr:RNase adapter RapZ [Syntrophomonadaceae bacterium]
MEEKSENLHILIITGLSGAGKTEVVNSLEDAGYYCVDNLPPILLNKFIELSLQSDGKVNRVALVIDVRGGAFFHDLNKALQELKQVKIPFEIIFLEASDEVLVRRFKESRRRHPLGAGRLLENIQAERKILEEIRGKANLVIDTSNLSPRDLKSKLDTLYTGVARDRFSVNVSSFGYKIGIPLDSDIIIDVRFIPNPFYDPVMKNMTGFDMEVQKFVLESPITNSFTLKFLSLLKFLIPHYVNEGKTNLELAIGCTGGQHRSVVLAEYIGRQIKKMGYNVHIRHRDISRYI